jgi:phage protein D
MITLGQNGSEVTGFDVTVGPAKLEPEALLHITAITVDLSINKTGMLTFEITTSDELPKDNYWIDDKAFAIGQPVRVEMGYGKDLTTLFGGEITGLEPSFSSKQPPSLIVRSYDRSHCLHTGTRNRTFTKMKYSDIAAQIAREGTLTPRVEDSRVIHEFVYQVNQSDLSFLRALANEIDYEVMVEDTELIFEPTASAAPETITLTLEKDLLEFSARLSATQQVSEVVLRGWNPKEKKEIVGRAEAGEGATAMGRESAASLGSKLCGKSVEIVSWRPVLSQAEADQLARSRLKQISLGLIEGSGSTEGRPELRPGKVIGITGVGERFSGRYYITDATHRFDHESGFRTNFTVRRDALNESA